MTEERTSPLRARMTEDIRIRGMGDKARKSHIRAITNFSKFLGRSPDTASFDDLRFFFGITCGREDSAGGQENDLGDRFPAKPVHAVHDPTQEAANSVQRAGGI